MAIQIIDNFELGAAKPIDNRFVVGPGEFYTDKNDISYKYTGLRVWDLTGGSPGIGYVWDGSAWQTEASSSVSGGGTANQLAKFIAPGNVVTDSIITDNGSRIGISWTNLAISPYTSHKLVVNGSIMSITGGFTGDGSNITNINASNISSGQLSLNYLNNSPTGKVLISGASIPSWSDQVQIGTAPTSGAPGNGLYFKNTITSRLYAISGSGLRFTVGAKDIDITEGILKIDGSLILGTQANKATIQYTTNTTRTFTIPNVGGNRTFAFLEQSQIFTTAQTIEGNSGTLLTINRNASGNNYTRLITTGANAVGIFYENSSGGRSLYMEGTGDLITGGNAGARFNNFRIENSSTDTESWPGGDGYFYIRDKFRLGSNTDTGQNGILQVTSNDISGINVDGASFKAHDDTNHIINFVNAAGSIRGKIRGNGAGAVLYDTTSDLRLKKDISRMGSMLNKIKMLNPSTYKWKADDTNGFGFIAQEVYNILPELRPSINSYCDSDSRDFDLDNPIDKNGNPYYYGLDYGMFTPFLTKALQEVIQNYEDLIEKIKNSDSLSDLKKSL